LYGLTECYGPAVVNDWHAEWDALPSAAQAAKKARQGVRYGALEALDVMAPRRCSPVPRDGETMGEVMMRGNVVMRGYLKNKKSTEAAFAGGWFHTGDLGVMHPDGYIQLKDRSKDIIISGGENISSIEVEDALVQAPAVQAPPWWRSRRQMGRDALRVRRAQARRERDAPTRSSRTARPTSPATRCRATSCSAKCRRRARGRFRSSDCARWPKKSNPAFAGYLAAFAGSAYIAVKEPAMGPHR
jgi:hypothetical protein